MVLGKVAEKVISQNEGGWAAQLKERGWSERDIQQHWMYQKRDGNCLFVFARVCKEWRKAQLKVGGPLRTRVRVDVIGPGREALVEWALAEGCPRESADGKSTMASSAAYQGHLELLQWLVQEEQGFPMDELVMQEAAGGGNLEVVQWLRGERCEWDEDTSWSAAIMGHLEVLQWLRGEGCPWNWRTIAFAAYRGHLEVVRWARENGCDWNKTACAMAAMGDRLEVLQWLRANGCPWSARTCYWAVDKGHVETLRWARENGAPWNAATRDKAAAELGYTDDLGNLVG